MTIDEAIKIAKKECKDHIALQYLYAIPRAIEDFASEGFHTQLLYAQTNMGSWRGETAREVKKIMRTYLKSKGIL